MNKTPMKSFEIIKEMYEYFVKKNRDLEPKLMICEKEDFDNVENALKRLEEIDKCLYLNNKQLKALEIIKKKPQTLYLVQTSENYEDYFNKVPITLMEVDYLQKEFELLKEVLL